MSAPFAVAAFPRPFPADWASAWGEDEYGLWLALDFRGAKQVFRWVEPGSFLMGSPENEPERFDDETQHPVTLTQGYWLAHGLYAGLVAGCDGGKSQPIPG